MRKIHLRDIILGGQDGLVNVLGLSLGLFAAHGTSRVILVAGLAAGFSEAVSMGGVAYTSALADRVRLDSSEKGQIAFDAFVVGIAAVVGALIPIIPFMFLGNRAAISISLVACTAILFGIGVARARSMGEASPSKSGIQMVVIGLVSALAGFLIGHVLKV